MPHCDKHKDQMATIFVTKPDGKKAFVCWKCKEAMEFSRLPAAERLARLKELEEELEAKEAKAKK